MGFNSGFKGLISYYFLAFGSINYRFGLFLNAQLLLPLGCSSLWHCFCSVASCKKNGLFITTKRSTVQRHTSCVDGLMTTNIYVDRLKKTTLVLYSRSIKHRFIWHVHCCPLRCHATINTYNLNAFNLILCQGRRQNKHTLSHCVCFSSLFYPLKYLRLEYWITARHLTWCQSDPNMRYYTAR